MVGEFGDVRGCGGKICQLSTDIAAQSTGISGAYCFLKGNEEIIDPMFDEVIVIYSGL